MPLSKVPQSMHDDGSVGTAQLADSAVATAKLADGALSADTAGRAKMADLFVTPAKLSQKMTAGTSQATTSGTAKDFTGIPSWARRITVALNGVSTNGTSQLQIQLGTSGGIENTGYSGAVDAASNAGSVSAASFTTGLGLERPGVAAAASVRSGVATLVNVEGNTWVGSWVGTRSDVACILFGATTKTLGGVLDRIRLTANGTDTFDAGSVNIIYEG